ncbi:MAG: right-handed parallel beta-helix repeat-containing protein [Planctomycetota bacterium]|jgi:hypothetical protein
MTGAGIVRSRQTIPILAAALVISSAAAAGKTIYVDDDAGGANDGSSWINAYAYLQDALGDAASAEKPVQVLVAQGLYKPDRGENRTAGDRNASFELADGVALLGGFAGLGEIDPDARDIESCATILSGDLNGDDVEVDSAGELSIEPSRSENSYHVVTGDGVDATAMLDGFIIVAGNANGSESNDPTDDKYALMRGGGMYNLAGSPIVINCIFSGNSGSYGGGMSNWNGDVSLIDCTFVWNCADRYGGGMDNCGGGLVLTNCTFNENSASWGGGMSNRAMSSPQLTNCTFTKNEVNWYGGGMINLDSSPTLGGCSFINNEATLGGGMRNSDSSPILSNCLIVDNVAVSQYGPYSWGPVSGRGGGMYNSRSAATLTNCTVSGNRAAIQAGGISGDQSRAVLTNCILWGNGPQQISGDASVSYSNIQGGWPGGGNLDIDPLFVRPGRLEAGAALAGADKHQWNEGDYHLKSRAGRWDPVGENWVTDNVSSPCIDAGEPTSVTGFEPLPNGGIINMGAYGGTVEASMSLLTAGSITDPASEIRRSPEEKRP